jgi:capsular polysaccharide biosynthesis protein
LRDHGLGYEIRHNVVLSLIGAYYHLLRTSEIQPKIELEGSYIFMYNTFTCANSGHDLSHIMACIQYLKTIPESENILLVLMKSTTTTWRTYEFLRLFFTDERFVWLDNNTVYNIKNVHIPVMREFSIQDFPDVVEQAVDMCGINPYSQNSIFLVKNTSMQQVLEKGTAFHCPKLIQRLKAAGWIILNPEIMHMKDIIWYLSSATNIVTSTGAILYTHMMFFSKEAKVFYLQHSDTFAPYACPGITYNIIRVPSLQIDDDMPKLYQKLPVINTSLTHT